MECLQLKFILLDVNSQEPQAILKYSYANQIFCHPVTGKIIFFFFLFAALFLSLLFQPFWALLTNIREGVEEFMTFH